MSKKSLIASLVVGVMLTLSLGLYALISSVMQFLYPEHTTVALAYTSNQVDADGAGISFGDYTESKGNLKLYFEGDKFVEFNSEDGVYRLVEGAYAEDAETGAKLTFKAVATTDEKLGSTTTYNVSIFKQAEDGALEYVVVNADNLMDLAEDSYNGGKVVTSEEFKINQLADIDLKGKDWKGLGTDRSPFHGYYYGNGYKVSNMTINVTEDNYTEYLDGWIDPAAGSDVPYTTMALGFFPATNGAQIKGLSIVDAKITIDPQVYSLVKGDANILWIRAGILVGYARNTVINGNSAAEGETATMAQVSGTVNGFTVANQKRLGGLGGLVGVLDDSAKESSTDDTGVAQKLTVSSVTYYNVDANISNIGLVDDPDTGVKVEIASLEDYIGGVAGVIRGHNEKTKLSNLNVKLTSNVSYKNQTLVGGVAAYAYDVEMVDTNTYEEGATKPTNIVINIDVRDNYASQSSFEAWAFGSNGSNYDADMLSQIGGVAAQLGTSNVEDVAINATYVNCFSINAGAVAVLSESSLKDVCILKGSKITGYVASGVVGYTYDGCTVEYSGEDVVTVDATVNGWFTAGLVHDAADVDIIGNGAKVKVVTTNYQNSNISRFLNNQSYSAGAVGYFYTTDTTTRSLSGLNVDATISNGVNMAGLVCYLGNDNSNLASSQNVVDNCTVDAKLNSIETSQNTNSFTHKVGGAIGTIYGSSQVKNVTVDVKFNKNHTSNNNYGVAMFGGLVARIGGVNVELTENTVTGSAYANNAAYIKFYKPANDAPYNAFYQFIIGGLVGAIADFDAESNVVTGGHPLNATATGTYDDLDSVALSAENFKIDGNTVSITLDVPYTAVACDNLSAWGAPEDTTTTIVEKYGYLARSLGTLVGLVSNDSANEFSLVGNNNVAAAQIVNENENTFLYKNSSGDERSSMGYHADKEHADARNPIGVAASATDDGNYEIFNAPAPEVPEVPEESEATEVA